MNESQSSPSPTPIIQPIILDTNIIQYSANKAMKIEILEYFMDLWQRKFILKISDITMFEIFSGSTVKQEEEIFKTLQLFPKYQVTNIVLLVAARISTLYGIEKLPNGEKKIANENISVPDKIIAATAIITNSLVMTADINHFPPPFLIGVENKLIFYQKKHKQCLEHIMLLQPNYPFILQRFNNRP